MAEKDHFLFEKYFFGELTKEEETYFDNQLKEDADFKASYLLYTSLRKDLSQTKEIEFKQQLKSEELRIKNTKKDQQLPQNRKVKKYWYAAAASLALISVLVLSSQKDLKSTPEQLFAQSFYKYDNILPSNTRSIEPIVSRNDSLLHLASYYYEIDEFSKTIDVLNQIQDTLVHEIAFMKTVVSLGNQECSDAIFQELLSLSKNEAFERKQAAEWYAALTALKMQNTAYKALIQSISNTKGHPFQQEALTLLEKLKSK